MAHHISSQWLTIDRVSQILNEGIKLDLCNMTSCYPFEVEG